MRCIIYFSRYHVVYDFPEAKQNNIKKICFEDQCGSHVNDKPKLLKVQYLFCVLF